MEKGRWADFAGWTRTGSTIMVRGVIEAAIADLDREGIAFFA